MELAAQNPFLNPSQSLRNSLLRPDVIFALGVVSILVVLILPMPSWLLDISLTISLTLSVVVLLTVLFIQKPLDFSSFPTVLLVTTMLRLSLNVASTRLILADGHTGSAAAGKVIQAFGNFIMGGNFVIGIIIFGILMIVNFVVITKGSGRIAEVSARFTLDSMPGKQMAIDADLSSGLINEEEAKAKRESLSNEANFFGSMDGAAKFVRGDAIAGLCITFINVIGGIIIGVGQMGLTLSEAGHTYTLLTVGDGLITQIPAIIVSTAAGMLVTKAGAEGSAEKAMFGQIGAYPAALGMTSVLLFFMSLLPGIPMFPFVMLGGLTGYGAWRLKDNIIKKQQNITFSENQDAQEAKDKVEQEATTTITDPIRLELGFGLLSLLNLENGKKLPDQVKATRKQLAQEVGFVIPPVRIQDNLELKSNQYVIKVKDIEIAKGEVYPDKFLVMDPQGAEIAMDGDKTKEPAFGLEAMWINGNQKEIAESNNYTVVDSSTVVSTHLTEIIKDNLVDLLSYTETQNLVDNLDKAHQKLLKDIVPGQISMANIQRILQNLLAERISIRDLPTILESIAEACNISKEVGVMTEHVRTRLARQICSSNSDDDGTLPVITMAPEWEAAFSESVIGDGGGKHLSIPPSKLQSFIDHVNEMFDKHATIGISPVLLTSPSIRSAVRSIVERFRPIINVMSQNEVHPRAKIQTYGQVKWE